MTASSIPLIAIFLRDTSGSSVLAQAFFAGAPFHPNKIEATESTIMETVSQVIDCRDKLYLLRRMVD